MVRILTKPECLWSTTFLSEKKETRKGVLKNLGQQQAVAKLARQRGRQRGKFLSDFARELKREGESETSSEKNL